MTFYIEVTQKVGGDGNKLVRGWNRMSAGVGGDGFEVFGDGTKIRILTHPWKYLIFFS